MADGPLAVILAAGQGTRMRSATPKVLHPLAGRPLVRYPVDLATAVARRRPVVVISPLHDRVRAALDGLAVVVEQARPLGTGDALRSVPEELREDGPVLVLSGDVPLLREATIRALLDRQADFGAACAVLTTVPPDATGLGRIVRRSDGAVTAIVEAADDPTERLGPASLECNAGVYVFSGRLLWPALDALTTGNVQGEYYLTDVVAMLDGSIETLVADDAGEALGINDRRQLAQAEAALRARVLDSLMLAGVTVEDPATTYVDAGVEVGSDTVLRPMTVLRGATVLGSDCVVGPMAQLEDVRAGRRVSIGSSHLEECVLGDDVTVGHFNRLRSGTTLHDGVWVGTHAEIKNSTVGTGSFISHFSTVLDSDLGRNVNIGAGTVTCNFDGRDKHRTCIDDDVFVGSDSILIAPLHIGAGAMVGAGSVINTDVPTGALAVERCRQRNVEGWATRRAQRS